MIRLFKKEENNIEKNLEINEQKEKAKQQKSKVLGQKPVKGERNKEKGTSVYNSSRL